MSDVRCQQTSHPSSTANGGSTSVVGAIKSFRDLIVWQKGMALVGITYELTKQLPEIERFGLTSQMRRCAVSIPSNIAEGQGRETANEYIRFLQIARGSAFELSTQAELCIQLDYGNCFQQILDNSEEVARILNGLISAIRCTVA